MRVAFLEIDAERSWAVASIGPAFLAAYLRAHGHEAVFLRIGLDETPTDIRQRVADAAPQLLATSLTTRQWLRGRQVIADLRAHLDIPVVAGGTGFYFRALTLGLFEGPGRDEGLRGRLEASEQAHGAGRLHRAHQGAWPAPRSNESHRRPGRYE